MDGAATGFDITQAVRLLTGVSWMTWALFWWEQSGTLGTAGLMSLFALGGGLGIVVIATTPGRRFPPDRADLLIFAGTLFIVGMWLVTRTTAHGYQTDEITTGQASATALLQGHNPYTTDLTTQLRAFNLPPQVSTPLFTGGAVHTTSYPALSFLMYVPLGLLAGTGGTYGLVTDGVMWLVLVVLLWRMVSPALRPVLPLIASAAFYVGFVDAGVTDSLFLPFLCIALYRWPRFVQSGTDGWRRWAGPVALGLACAVKPLPWLVAPFLVAGIALEASHAGRSPLRVALQYAAATVAAFGVVNGPFILLDPGAWARDTLLPVTQALVPFGQGLVQLPLYMHVGGGRVGLFSVVADAALLASFVAFLITYPRSRRALPLFAIIPLVLSSRSLINYFAALALLALVGATTVAAGDGAVLTSRVRRAGGVVVAVLAATAAAVLGVVLASPAPLQLQVTGQDHAGVAAALVVTVRATNLSGSTITPRFAVTSGGFMDPSWGIISGPAQLGAGQTATYRISSPSTVTFIDPGTTYLVDVLSAGPAAVSTSDWVTAP